MVWGENYTAILSVITQYRPENAHTWFRKWTSKRAQFAHSYRNYEVISPSLISQLLILEDEFFTSLLLALEVDKFEH